MRTRILPAATALAVLLGSVVLAAGTATADSAKVLPVGSAGDVVVDGVHKRVFISDPTQGKVVATDYAGTVLGTVSGLPRVEGLALSADSEQLYAAVPGDDSVVAVSTRTVTPSARYATGDNTAPEDVVLAGGKLWFSYSTGTTGNIGSLEVSGEEPVVTLGQDDESGWYGTPKLDATPGAPDLLVAGDPNTTSSRLGVYDVSDGTAVRTASAAGSHGRNVDFALTPDGSRLITANSDKYHWILRTSDLAETGSYPTTDYANAVDVRADGTVAAGSDSWYDTDVHVFQPGATKAVRQYDFPNTGNTSASDTLAAGALAWEPGGGRLFAVSGNSRGVYSLRVLTDPTKSVTTLTATAPASATRAKALTVKGRITASVALPAGTPLTVTRTDLESPKGTSLGTKKTTDAKGTFSFSDTPPAGGKVTYKVTYAGSATHTASSASAKVNVSRAAPGLKLDRNGKVYAYGTAVSFTAHLGTTYKNRTVEIYADPYGADKPKKLIKKGKVNSKGNLSATVKMTRNTTVTATFTGDARYATKSVKSTAQARAKVSTSVSRHYKTGKIGSTTYAYFHKKTNPLFTTAMTYHKGRAQRFTMEMYYDGRWYSLGDEYFSLGTNGKSAVELAGERDTGIRVRMRSSYIKGTSGDNVNYTTHGAWKYFIFTK
ncbi:YncE family protein [Streptomyces corynorhini]|uniref:WD40 repeat domain-containing protein n=1 Tax=Streptomyces corynorhini TaxID=2282652 RepID=A0A370B4Z4_9ACTN|nr:WD40 repeat domain-containing protein [Streptomyces corynorhini]RDG34816.1 WD40 repeat domain-containing protein [Streptomyces corynorhini]